MKNKILSILYLCITLCSCKEKTITEFHPIVSSSVPQTEPVCDSIIFDYSIDTLLCDLEHFRNMYDNGGQPRKAEEPNAVYPMVISFYLLPSESNQLVYGSYDGSNAELFNVDFTTKAKHSITTSMVANDYSVCGDLVLFSKDGKVWRMKTNGNNLVSLIDSVYGNVKWNHDRSKLCFRPYGGNLVYAMDSHLTAKIYIADVAGKVIDTIYVTPITDSFDCFDWSKKDIFVQQRRDGSIIGYNTKTKERSLLVHSFGEPNGFCWLSDYKTMAVSTIDGLYIVDTKTQQFRKIRCSAIYNSWYSKPQYSRKHKRIFALKVQILSPYTFNQILVSMNIDGSDEKQVDIR